MPLKPNDNVFDIETIPLPIEQILAICGPFNPDNVKLGNLKDAEKKAAKIAEAQESYESDLLERAALDPMLGRVAAIGMMNVGTGKAIVAGEKSDDEKLLVAGFWKKYTECRSSARQLIGFNIEGFDLPFLVQRSWILGIEIPETLIESERYFDRTTFADLMKVWTFGGYKDFVSIDKVARALGVGCKNGDGADFAKMWVEDRPKAIAYAVNDLKLTAEVAKRIYC
jgi:predicted PolB exonuclease-like 3'-5' exonuclease